MAPYKGTAMKPETGVVPPHLGGHSNKTWIDPGSLKLMYEKYNVRTMIDVGCGPGGQVAEARKLGIEAIGFDGDHTVNPDVLIDFTKVDYETNETWDLAWCVEFLEHVDEQYLPNYMALLSKCKYVICTASTWPGPLHVNCKERDYWVEKFSEYGFTFSQDMLDDVLKHSTMAKKVTAKEKLSWLDRTGMVYINTKMELAE
jgi:SAM-dependent methyltransferase